MPQFTEWEKGYAFQNFMEGKCLGWITTSINCRSKKSYSKDDIQNMIRKYIRENLQDD